MRLLNGHVDIKAFVHISRATTNQAYRFRVSWEQIPMETDLAV
ncbi:MAG: hypothetical protein ACYC9L_12285 [Sulfuricaulis sp.]